MTTRRNGTITERDRILLDIENKLRDLKLGSPGGGGP